MKKLIALIVLMAGMSIALYAGTESENPIALVDAEFFIEMENSMESSALIVEAWMLEPVIFEPRLELEPWMTAGLVTEKSIPLEGWMVEPILEGLATEEELRLEDWMLEPFTNTSE